MLNKILNELKEIPITVKKYDYNRPEPEAKKSSRTDVEKYDKAIKKNDINIEVKDKEKVTPKTNSKISNIQKVINSLSDRSIKDLEKYVKILKQRDLLHEQ